jgi:predicted MFS family arabinose efflux permease
MAPGPLLLAAIFLPYSASYAALTGFLPTLLIERMALSPGTAGMLAAAVAGANIVGNLASGPLLRRGLQRWSAMAITSTVIAVTSFGIFAPAMPGALAYVLCLIFSAAGGLLPGCVLGGAAVFAPERRLVPTTLGLLMQGSNLGQLIGPVAVGVAVGGFGWPGARLVLIPASLLGIVLALVLRRLSRER